MTDYYEHPESDCDEADQILNERVNYMSSNFTLEDFLEFDKTRDFLTQNYLWQFEQTCGEALEKFYENEVNFCRKDMSTLFKNEINHTNSELFKSIVLNNLEPIYDLDMIYCDESLSRIFVEQREEQSRKNKERKNKERLNTNVPTVKKFNWENKRIN
jgi:hypothetical protein